MLIKLVYRYTQKDETPRLVRLLIQATSRIRAEEIAMAYHKKHHPDELINLHVLSAKFDHSYDAVLNLNDIDLFDIPKFKTSVYGNQSHVPHERQSESFDPTF